ncbi:hypothetical protein CHUAL_012714 [Chamberlinius hualienensis]
MPNCTAMHCRNTFGKGYRMFRFPSKVRDRERHDQWVQNMNRPEGWVPAPSARLCHVHFEPDQFESRREDGLTKLKPNAVPTLFIDLPDSKIISSPPKKRLVVEKKSKMSSTINKKMNHLYFSANTEKDSNDIQVIPVLPVAMYVSTDTNVERMSTDTNVMVEVDVPPGVVLEPVCVLSQEVIENGQEVSNVAYVTIEEATEMIEVEENVEYIQEISNLKKTGADLNLRDISKDVSRIEEPEKTVETGTPAEADKNKKPKRTATFTWDAHARKLTSGLWDYFQSNFGTDFEISSSNGTISVHQLILSIFCPISKIATKRRVKLNIDKADLNVLVEFLYCGKVDIPYERMPSVMVAARQLGFTALANMIEKFIVVAAHIKPKPVQKPNTSNFESTPTKSGSKTKTCSKYTQTMCKFKSTENESDDVCNTIEQTTVKNVEGDNNPQTTFENDNPKKSKKQIYTCNVCDKRFKCRVQYFKHGKEHLNPDELAKCKYCSYTSKSELGLSAHVGIKHKDVVKSKIYSCNQCKYVCRKSFYLKMHMENSHGSNVFLCEKCPYTCKSRIVLKNHFRVYHSDAKPFMCDKCDYRSKTKTGLKYHEEKHQDKVICDVCGLSLKMSTMRKHKDIHSGKTKRFTCNLCTFGTRDRTNLRVHLKNVHSLSEDEAQKIVLTNFPYATSNLENRSFSMMTSYTGDNVINVDSQETTIDLQFLKTEVPVD